MCEKDCERVCIWQRPELRGGREKVKEGGNDATKRLEKCNKKIGRKRGTKGKVKAIIQMGLVKQESKDKGREGGMGRGGGGIWDRAG